MPTETTEPSIEASIERFLTGDVCTPTSDDGKIQEAHAADQADKGCGYLRGQSSDFNTEFAIDEATYPDELAKLHYKPDYRRQILKHLHRKLKKQGILSVLNKGLDIDNVHFDFLYRFPTLRQKLFQFRRRLRNSTRQPVSVISSSLVA